MKTKIRVLLFLIVLPIMIFSSLSLFKFTSWLSGARTNTVILSSSPLTLSSIPTVLKSGNKAEVVGLTSSACLSFGGSFTRQHMDKLEKDSLLDGAIIVAYMTTLNGTTYPLTRKVWSWSSTGTIAENDELSVCMALEKSQSPPKGTIISSVKLSSYGKVGVQGVYWKSTNQ